MEREIFTIGYSAFELEEFIKVLHKYKIDGVIDVRSNPVSAYFTDYDKNNLATSLEREEIFYDNYKEEFGARQNDKKFFTDGCLDFQKFMNSEQFQVGTSKVENLINEGHKLALMCAEKYPQNCHRCIMVARYFSDNDYLVKNILADGEYQTQADVEKILVNKYFKDAEQFSLFNDESKMINISYELQNKKIGYRLTTEDLSE